MRELPESLRPLGELALDVRWTWSHAADAIWRRVDERLWEETGNPWLMLQLVSAARLRELALDASFVAELNERVATWRAALDAPGWFAEVYGADSARIAYFSMEFGLDEALPLYAGGLGILAGDHLKTASDLGIPLVGVGIYWQQGYFRQMLGEDGWQQELAPYNDPASLPIQPLLDASGDPLEISLDLPGRRLRLRCWSVRAGRTRLLLLDTNHALNRPVDRGLTGTLYGSDPEVRLLQELILGIGGWRLLRALGYDIDVCHLNEGHAAFVIIERAHSFMRDHGVSFREALWATRGGNVFTTHTAVSAGFDTFGSPIIRKYRPWFDAYVQRLGITWPELLALGRTSAGDDEEPFAMAYLAVRGAARVNGVSELHGEVSRRLFGPLFPRRPEHEVPVTHVTNGVHVPSWDSAGADKLWTAACGKERWRGELERVDEAIAECTDEELWALRNRERADIVRLARARLRIDLAQRGHNGAELDIADSVLDADVLTLGFARRFTAYKRPNLLLSDRDRLRRLLTSEQRPVQLLVAGKAHPADLEGKRLIADWLAFSREAAVRRRVVFIEDYDMTVARELVQGVDVWLNTPRRPWEASGTSGMKVLVNGGMNASSLDGWWAEAWTPEVGWALSPTAPDGGSDESDAQELYTLLESDVVPCFHERDEHGIPRRWLQRVRNSMGALTSRFSSNRMLREYVERMYLPAAHDYRARAAGGGRLARELSAWESRLVQTWADVRFENVDAAAAGGTLTVRASVRLGRVRADDVRVELYADGSGDGPPITMPMAIEPGGSGGDDTHVYAATLRTARAPADFTPRVVPHHPHAHVPAELTLIAWQR